MSSTQHCTDDSKQPPAVAVQPNQSQWVASWMVRLSISVILLIHAALLLDSSRKNFVVIDEAAHLVAGISHWTTGTYSMYRVNPPLPRMLAVIPDFLLRPDTKAIQPSVGPAKRSEYDCANPFALDNAAQYLNILFLARLAGILWSCLGGWLMYRWGSELYSVRAGLLGLILWCFNPSILAHAQVATPDLPATVAGFAAVYCFWRYLRCPSWSSALIAGLVLGIAELTKFTLLYLYALLPVLWLLYRLLPRQHGLSCRTAFPGRPDNRRPDGLGRPSYGKNPFATANKPQVGTLITPFRSQFRQCLGIIVISILVINLGYEFQDTGKPLGKYVFVSRALAGEPPPDLVHVVTPINRFEGSWLGSIPVPLPAEFLAGIDRQRLDFELGLLSYLRGEWKRGGWWYYYFYAFIVKSPLGVLALIVWGLTLTLIGHAASARMGDEAFVWLPALAIMVLVSSQMGFNHHLRYILPLFPFVLLGASKLAYFLSSQHWKSGLLVLVLVFWSLVSTVTIHPHYLSYFNEAAGGPDNGHNHLIDSNIDWGQDVLFLKAWLDQHPEAHPLGLACFNTIDPRIVGIDFTLPPPGPISADIAQGMPTHQLGPRPGYYALDVNFVRGFAYSVPNGKGQFVFSTPHQYEYFQRFQPIAKAGYSIFIYHITLEDANRFRREWGLPLLTDTASSKEKSP